ncbi:MAG: MoaD/ThiS family protein [Deltaproteobacteria bacterium]|nr:MoaD/ThiS family protein [Deltaproteobacteria bacterium]PIY22286.1 MAG: ThiS family protein [Deltaproteobacteria bacterium CG_4_10_14_3_um_filter_51_14]PJB36998.1 MAG: ThiS family protein [Deltaproteobacteria bacterium CG_4_9_14_3_um_filter_51_14]
MTIKLNIHKTHRQYTDGLETLDVAGSTIGACIDELIHRFPAMKDALFDGKEKLKNQIEIYLNMESAYPDELKKKVTAGDEIYITVMLTGG